MGADTSRYHKPRCRWLAGLLLVSACAVAELPEGPGKALTEMVCSELVFENN